MSRYWGRAAKGEKIPEAIPAGHWRSFTLLGAMTHSGLLATMTVEDSTDTDVFLAFLDQVLCPKLQAGHIMVMDNLQPTRRPPCGRRSKLQVPACCICRLILPTSTPSKNAGPRSSCSCEL